jgi:hypothetical protein
MNQGMPFKKQYDVEMENCFFLKHDGITVGLSPEGDAMVFVRNIAPSGEIQNLVCPMSIDDVENICFALADLVKVARNGKVDA